MKRFSALVNLYGVCLKNAEALLLEAQLLFDHGHFARSYALAYTGWEEMGKAQITADFAYHMAAEEEFDAAFNDHKLKSAYNWRKFVINTKNIEDSTIEYDRATATKHFETRNTALYVGKTGDLRAIEPLVEITEEIAETILTALSRELDDIRTFAAMNERMGSKSFLK